MTQHACLRRNPKTLNYEYRKVIPKSLRAYLGKTEIKRSFATKLPDTELLSLYYATSLEVERMIDKARSACMSDTQKELKEPSLYELRVCMTSYLNAQLDIIKSASSSQQIQAHIMQFDISIMAIQRSVSGSNHKDKAPRTVQLANEYFGDTFQTVLADYGHVLGFNHPQYNKALLDFYYLVERLCVTAANLIYNGKDITGYEGYTLKPSIIPENKYPVEPDVLNVRKDTKKRPEKTLAELLEAYKDNRRLVSDSKTIEKALYESEQVLNQFSSLFEQGLDVHLADIHNDDADDFRVILQQLPPAMKLKAFNQELYNKPIREQLTGIKDAGLVLLGKKTVSNKIKRVSAVISFAVDRRWLDSNPFDGVAARVGKDKGAKQGGDKRYSNEDLVKIFSGDIFVKTSGNSDLWRSSFGEATYWQPLIMYYTGARAEEVSQLYVKDLKIEEDINYIYITDEESDQSVKTGRRKVPIHPDLIKLGLLNYANTLGSDCRLFPELNSSSTGKYSEKLSSSCAKRFRKYYGADASVAPFHGFRHTFKTISRRPELAMPEGHVKQLQGHSDSSVSEAYGGYEMQSLHGVMCRYPGLANFQQLLKDGPWVKPQA
jgi:integrase